MFWHLGVEQFVDGNIDFWEVHSRQNSLGNRKTQFLTVTKLLQRPTIEFVKPARLLDTGPPSSQPPRDFDPGLFRLNLDVRGSGEHRLFPLGGVRPQEDGGN